MQQKVFNGGWLLLNWVIIEANIDLMIKLLAAISTLIFIGYNVSKWYYQILQTVDLKRKLDNDKKESLHENDKTNTDQTEFIP